jgi:hypothetical protein
MHVAVARVREVEKRLCSNADLCGTRKTTHANCRTEVYETQVFLSRGLRVCEVVGSGIKLTLEYAHIRSERAQNIEVGEDVDVERET